MGYVEWFQVIGGLGLLLFGMKMLSTGLEVVAGDSLQAILKKATTNRFLGVIVGIVSTVCLNSSTALTIIVVGFVNSKLLTLQQAVGVIMGANVGTTFSAQLLSFKFSTLAPLIIFVGVIMYQFLKNKKIKNIGYVFIGFGVLLFSITVMTTPLKQLADDPTFQQLLDFAKNPLMGILVGFIFTAINQASLATMAVLIALNTVGDIPFEASAFIILGTNIGTSTTTVIASIPASRDSKRAGLFHITYDIIGTIVFGTIISIFRNADGGYVILEWFKNMWPEGARQVAMFHTLYNVATLCLLLPFVKQLSWMLQKVIPLKESEINNKTHAKQLMFLDDKVMQTPTLTVVNAQLEICRMWEIANENIELALDAFYNKNEEKAEKALKNEQVIDFLNQHIAAKLVEINNMTLSEHDAAKVGEMFKILIDIERIGDHAENIAEYAEIIKDHNIEFSPIAKEEITELSNTLMEMVTKSLETYKNEDSYMLDDIEALEESIDRMSEAYSENHIKRLKQESCNPKGGVVFTDMIIDLERIADHAYNIAFSIVPASKATNRA